MKRLLVLFFVFAVATLPAATVKGRVFDQSGAVTPGAILQLVNLVDASQVYKTTSGADGTFEFLSIVAGKYELQTLARGFAYWRRPNIVLESNSNMALNVVLRVGSIQEEITVSGQGQVREAQGPQRIRVGGSVQATRVLHMVKPIYPDKAKAEGREGTITFVAVIDKEGGIRDLVSMDGADSDLLDAARSAVLQWRYQPTLLNGSPVEVITSIDINFRLAR